MFIEEWRDIPGYEGLYQVSNTGRVKSLNYKHTGKEGFLKPCTSHNGYLYVTLCKDKKYRHYFVHRIVWVSFVGLIPHGMQVNHIDECKTNNFLENLNLLSCRDNNNWGTHTERMKNSQINRKDLSKWVIQLSMDNEILHFYPSTVQAQRETGINCNNISNVCRGVGYNKSAGGFKWVYAD